MEVLGEREIQSKAKQYSLRLVYTNTSEGVSKHPGPGREAQNTEKPHL